jgi:hypothetical protein
MNVTGYTRSSSNVCVCVCSHKWAKIVFFLLSFFRLHISEQWKKVVARKTSNSSQVSRSSIYKSGLKKRKSKKELDDILTTNNYREHECATADLLCIAMIVVLCERRIYSNFTAELYTHIQSGARPFTYATKNAE